MKDETIPQKAWQWLKRQIVGPVPEADALCEYDCRKEQCSDGEWATCERRIHKAAGELWPESKSDPRSRPAEHGAKQDAGSTSNAPTFPVPEPRASSAAPDQV